MKPVTLMGKQKYRNKYFNRLNDRVSKPRTRLPLKASGNYTYHYFYKT
jgi:hypothetical protein